MPCVISHPPTKFLLRIINDTNLSSWTKLKVLEQHKFLRAGYLDLGHDRQTSVFSARVQAVVDNKHGLGYACLCNEGRSRNDALERAANECVRNVLDVLLDIRVRERTVGSDDHEPACWCEKYKIVPVQGSSDARTSRTRTETTKPRPKVDSPVSSQQEEHRTIEGSRLDENARYELKPAFDLGCIDESQFFLEAQLAKKNFVAL